MDNYKTFISHSSVQKDFVAEVVKELGRDFVNVDMYCFEAGEELNDEIANHIDKSNIFVLMLSDMALNSRWVIQEVKQVRAKMLDGEDVVFLPFIIDDAINHDDTRLEKNGIHWIKKYLIAIEKSPSIVARIIRRRLREAIWEHEPNIKEREKLFFGRDTDMNELRLKLYGTTDNRRRCVIISGLPHVGRKRLIKEFIWRHINNIHEAYDPIRIIMTESDGIDRFIQQVNEVVRLYDKDVILDLMKDSNKSLNAAIVLLNKVADYQERIFIRDEKCIVLGNGILTNWFVELIKSRELHPMIHLFVASRFTPSINVDKNIPEVISRQIKGIDRPNIKALFNAYAKNMSVTLSEDQTEVFVSKLSGYPRQIYDIVDCIAEYDLHTAQMQMPQIASAFDNNLVDILKEIEKTPEAKNILVLLSQFDFISFDMLEQICPVDITDALTIFRNFALYESFGSANQYIRISPLMGDYISRNRLLLPQNYRQALRAATRGILANMDKSLTDLSSQLLAIKEILRNPKTKAKERYLIPSFVLKVIIEEYKAGNNSNVIDLSELLLKNSAHENDEITRSVHYWYCCALCRMKDDRFLKEVKYFKNYNYSYNFLRGFFERQKRNFEKAEGFYEKALEQSTRSRDREYVSKAEHELVIVKMELEDYHGALELAQKSYEREKNNSYHIEAYFRCLVRSAHPDILELKELIRRMEQSYAEGKEVIAKTMAAEYKYYIDHDFPKMTEMMKAVLRDDMTVKKSYAERAFRKICKDNDSAIIFKNVMNEIHNK